MNRNKIIFLLIAIFSLSYSYAGNDRSNQNELTLSGHLNRSCISQNGGTAYLHIEVGTPVLMLHNRRPVNIAVVLDRSGSMADERKIEYAKAAITSLIDRLDDGDYLSVVIYDNRIDVLIPRQRVMNKNQLKNIVREIFPRSSTNLGDGMKEGFRQIEETINREYVNRVILLSDGLANQGITDPNTLKRIAAGYRAKSISLSTMGVGLDYNENLLLGLAQTGGGNYYYIESPSQLAGMFEQELNGLSTVVVQDASIELTLGRGVELNDVIGCGWERGRSTKIIPLGDLYAGEHRELTLEIAIPPGHGRKQIATGVLHFESKFISLSRPPSFSVDIRYTNILAELDKGTDWDVQGKVDVALSTRKVERAMEALDAGNQAEASRQMYEARSMIQSSGAMKQSSAAAPMLREQMTQLEGLSNELNDTSKDAREKKKSIQYQNYKTQKKK